MELTHPMFPFFDRASAELFEKPARSVYDGTAWPASAAYTYDDA